MGQKWIIDVLSDLQRFAEANDLPELAAQLAATQVVASDEIAAASEVVPLGVRGHDDKVGPLADGA